MLPHQLCQWQHLVLDGNTQMNEATTGGTQATRTSKPRSTAPPPALCEGQAESHQPLPLPAASSPLPSPSPSPSSPQSSHAACTWRTQSLRSRSACTSRTRSLRSRSACTSRTRSLRSRSPTLQRKVAAAHPLPATSQHHRYPPPLPPPPPPPPPPLPLPTVAAAHGSRNGAQSACAVGICQRLLRRNLPAAVPLG